MDKAKRGTLIASIVSDPGPESAELERLILEWDGRPLSLEEVYAQRVSFVIGMLPSRLAITRDEVQEILDREYGRVGNEPL